MAAYAGIIKRSTLAAVETWPRHEPFSLHESMLAITLDVILHAIFGIDSVGRLRRFATLLGRFLHRPPGFLSLVAFQFDLPLSPYRWYRRSRREVDAEIYRLIAERRRAPDLAERHDVLSSLLLARDDDGRCLTDDDVHDELITLITAGHETSATALAWMFERLLRTPEAYAKATTEARRWIEAPATDPAEPTPLTYLDAVVKEGLRLRPVVPFILRTVVAPYSIAGYTLPPGVKVAPCTYLAHHREASFAEPDRFLPERWLGAKVDPYTWFPFGGGGRRCVGMAFAVQEMKVILATVLARVRLRAAGPGSERTTWSAVLLAPSKGVQAIVEPAPEAGPYSRGATQ